MRQTRLQRNDILTGEAPDKIAVCKHVITVLSKFKEAYGKAYDEFRNNPSINDNDAA